MVINKLKNNTMFKSPKHITDQQINLVNDYAFWKENTVQSKDEIKLLLAQTKASRIYYKYKIYIGNSYLFQKASKKNIGIFINKLKILIEKGNSNHTSLKKSLLS